MRFGISSEGLQALPRNRVTLQLSALQLSTGSADRGYHEDEENRTVNCAGDVVDAFGLSSK